VNLPPKVHAPPAGQSGGVTTKPLRAISKSIVLTPLRPSGGPPGGIAGWAVIRVPSTVSRSIASVAFVPSPCASSTNPSGVANSVRSTNSGSSGVKPVMTEPRPAPIVVVSSHASRPRSRKSSSLASQTACPLPSRVPAGTSSTTSRIGDGFASGSPPAAL
jgi:hypothetical protein